MAATLNHSVSAPTRIERGWQAVYDAGPPIVNASFDVSMDLADGFQATVHVEASGAATVDILAKSTADSGEAYRSILTSTYSLSGDGFVHAVPYGFRSVKVSVTGNDGTVDVHAAAVRQV